MRSVKFFVIIAAAVLWAHVGHAQVWQNEPVGSTRKVDCAFNTNICAGGGGTFFDVYNSIPIVIDTSSPISPPNIAMAKMTYTGPCSNGGVSFLQCGGGGGHLEWFNNAPTRELYMGVMFKINPSYSCSLVGKSKIFFMRAVDNRFGAEPSNGVFIFGGCGETKVFEFAHNSGNLNNGHICGGDEFGALCYNNVGSGAFQRGQWVKFEACIRASSTLTARDGAVRWWVNGVEAGRYTALNYGSGVVNEWVWNQTWDGYGNGQGFSSDAIQYVDHLVLSIPPNGGCMASATGGTTPPSPTPPPPSPTPPPPSPTPPPATTNPGIVSDLTVTPQSATTAKMTFTAVHDGAGNPAKYDNRLALSPISWGAAASISVGTCASPFMPSNAIGQQIECLITGLSAGQSYQSQNASFRGTMNAGAIYGGLSNVASFTMPSSNEPVITTFTPSSGIAGVSVTISGLNFSTTLANNTVKFNGQPAVVTAASAEALTVTVPDGVTTGRISIQTDQGIVYSDQNFSVGASGGGCGCS